MTAEQAIERSVTHSEIVSIAWSADLADALSVESEDSVDANGVTEYWGTTESGAEWRVHLTGATDEQIEELRSEAASAGDMEQVHICDRALRGNVQAREECERVIRDAKAQEG